jgi:hypothetical protein
VGGPSLAADPFGDAIVVFVQGNPGQRQVVVGYFVRPPSKTVVTTVHSSKHRPIITWRKNDALFGVIAYTVFVDNRQIGKTSELQVASPISLRRGKHRVRVDATDIRGQTTKGKDRTLTIGRTRRRGRRK